MGAAKIGLPAPARLLPAKVTPQLAAASVWGCVTPTGTTLKVMRKPLQLLHTKLSHQAHQQVPGRAGL